MTERKVEVTRMRNAQALINIVALAVTLIANFLATSIPLGDRTTAEISDSFDLRFVPAGYVFAIWGLIYLALLGFAFYQALPSGRDNPSVRATGWAFAVTCAANAAWILAWHYGYYPLSLGIMLVLLGSLALIYTRLTHIQQPNVEALWLVHRPFSLYLGWISVATIANASAVLVDAGWRGEPWTEVGWATLMVLVAAALAIWMLRRFGDLVFAGVVVWALVGIIVAQSDYAPIVVGSALGVIAIMAASVMSRRPVKALAARGPS